MGLSRAIHNGDAGVRFKLPKGSSLGIAYVDDDRISHGRRRVRGTESSDIRSLCFPTGSTATGASLSPFTASSSRIKPQNTDLLKIEVKFPAILRASLARSSCHRYESSLQELIILVLNKRNELAVYKILVFVCLTDDLGIRVAFSYTCNSSYCLGIGMEVSDLSGTMDVTAILASSPYDKWFALSTSGWCPSARYKHAAEFVNERLYVVGGSRNGRYLSDVQVFDFRTLRWSTLRLEVDKDGSRLDTVDQEKGFPAVAGHSLVNWENKLLVVAGFTKELLDYVTSRVHDLLTSFTVYGCLIWSIDLETNICSFVATYGKIPIARGGQSTTLVGSKLFMFGGEDRKRKLLNDLHTLDLTTMTWEEIGTKNASPAPRFDHSAAVYADQYLLIFGGSSHSICFNDLHLLDLRTVSTFFVALVQLRVHTESDLRFLGLTCVPANGSISFVNEIEVVSTESLGGFMPYGVARVFNCAAMVYLNYIGYDTVPTIVEEVCCPECDIPFDVSGFVTVVTVLYCLMAASMAMLMPYDAMEWSQPQTQGAYVTPRGGHAGTLVNENWYIVGGGDNISGATETVALNISKLVWLITTNVGKRDPLASEGLTLCSAVLDGEKFIIAFGGYNGKYNNEIFVLKIKPKEPLQRRLLQSPAAAAAAASVTAAYAIITATDEKNIAMRNSVNPDVKSNEIENVQKLSAIDTDTLKAENKLLESRIMQARDENSRLQTKIDEMNTTHTELLKELQSVQNQLTAESARCLNLETHIAEMQKSLESFSSLEHEIDMLRHQKSQVDQEMVVVQKQRSGGVWQWLSGTADDV
ncbi:hypothetical protein ZIOFF_071827 [Zingiber officinale]|uniref:Acyl-CoA-binding domain-containing protein n=1 Tax=Zingiber officinale TaxID=94328 RepID=A0A8J5C276_ZINOF|nr:hypothetical protein ZIOFF_071827 [Zingiber officinale]